MLHANAHNRAWTQFIADLESTGGEHQRTWEIIARGRIRAAGNRHKKRLQMLELRRADPNNLAAHYVPDSQTIGRVAHPKNRPRHYSEGAKTNKLK